MVILISNEAISFQIIYQTSQKVDVKPISTTQYPSVDMTLWTLIYYGFKNNYISFHVAQPATSYSDRCSYVVNQNYDGEGNFYIGGSFIPNDLYSISVTIQDLFIYPNFLIANKNHYFFDTYLINNFPSSTYLF